jgi:hypothetical protein
MFLSITLNSSCQQINIVLTKDRIHILTNIVITDPTRADLLFWSCTTQGFVAFDATQAKEKSYRNWHPPDQFLPFATKVLGYTNILMCFYMIVPMPFGAWKG